MATLSLDFIDKVFFVVDRKDLDYQTMKEYQRFSPDSVNGSENTAGLKRNIDKDDNKDHCNYYSKAQQPNQKRNGFTCHISISKSYLFLTRLIVHSLGEAAKKY